MRAIHESINPEGHRCRHDPQPLDVDGDRESEIRMVEEALIFHLGKWRTRVEARFVFENTRADSTVR